MTRKLLTVLSFFYLVLSYTIHFLPKCKRSVKVSRLADIYEPADSHSPLNLQKASLNFQKWSEVLIETQYKRSEPEDCFCRVDFTKEKGVPRKVMLKVICLELGLWMILLPSWTRENAACHSWLEGALRFTYNYLAFAFFVISVCIKHISDHFLIFPFLCCFSFISSLTSFSLSYLFIHCIFSSRDSTKAIQSSSF